MCKRGQQKRAHKIGRRSNGGPTEGTRRERTHSIACIGPTSVLLHLSLMAGSRNTAACWTRNDTYCVLGREKKSATHTPSSRLWDNPRVSSERKNTHKTTVYVVDNSMHGPPPPSLQLQVGPFSILILEVGKRHSVNMPWTFRFLLFCCLKHSHFLQPDH